MMRLNFLPARYRESADPLRTERRVELLMLLFILLLGLQFAYSASRVALVSVPEAIVPAADSLQVASAVGTDTVSASQSKEIRNRPLFWAGRRPVKVVTVDSSATDEAQAGEIDGIQLLGVFGGGDSAGIIALVGEKQRRVLVGEKVSGWRLASVTANEAQFTAGVRRRSLVLLPGAPAVAAPKKTRKNRSGSGTRARSNKPGRERMRKFLKQRN